MSTLDAFTPSDTLLSLTTIFTPPSSCRTHWTYEGSFYNSISGGILLQNALEAPLDTACFPSGFSNYGRQSLSQIFSPGHCPVGYTTPAQYLNGMTTTYVCCQNSFTYFTTVTTINNFSPTSALIFAGCISTYPKSSGVTIVPVRVNDMDISPSTQVSGPLTMWGQPIQVAFQQQDLSFYTTSTSIPATSVNAQPSSSPTSQAAATITPLSPSTTPTSVSDNPTGLSPGAKAGIGVGIAMIGIFLLGSALFILWRRKRRARFGENGLTGTSSEEEEKEKPSREEAKERSALAEFETPPPELDSNARSELPDRPSKAPIVEIDSREHVP